MGTIEKRGQKYRARVRLTGEEQRTRTFTRKTDADLWIKKVESDLGHGVYVPTTVDRRRTLADLIDKFEKEYFPIRRNNADHKKMSAQLKWWREQAGYVTLDKLAKPQTIAGFRSELLARRTGRGPACASILAIERAVIAGLRPTPMESDP